MTAASTAHAESYRPLDHLWMGTRDLPNTESLVVLGAGTAATVGALFIDQDVHDFFAGKSRMGNYSKLGNKVLGTGVPGAMTGAGMIVYGLLHPDEHYVSSGEAHLEGLVASAVFTNLLKFTVRRARPDSDSRTSFPSGHTSTTFTSAAVLLDMHGPAVGVPALLAAAYTGVCRLDVNAHHLSDVLFGAALGFAVGHSYTLHHGEEQRPDATRVSLAPYADSLRDFGVELTIR